MLHDALDCHDAHCPARSLLQDNSQHFYNADHSPADRSPVLPSQPESASCTETKNRACPSAYQRAGLAQHFQEFHRIIVIEEKDVAVCRVVADLFSITGENGKSWDLRSK